MTHKQNDKPTPLKVLLAIPVYNEAKYLDDFLNIVTCYIRDVLVIDDGSTDGSRQILAARNDVVVLSHCHNMGYGRSIIAALHYAADSGYEWVITMDCDLQHEPERLPDFLEAIADDDADIISGSRYVDCEKRHDCPPPDRRQINKVITKRINETLGLKLTDGFCGFKACRVAASRALDLTEPGYAMPLEFWVQVAHHGLRVRELPVSLIYIDPNRHFGGELDDPTTRLNHYEEVFAKALAAVNHR